MRPKVSVFWFRRDLRLYDNAGLYYALRSENPVLPVFIFDTNILEDLSDAADARVSFIHDALTALDQQLKEYGSGLYVGHGKPADIYEKLFSEYEITGIFTNIDFEEYSIVRDREVKSLAEKYGAGFYPYKDQVIFDGREIKRDDGEPYSVFTPFYKKWRASLNPFYLKPYPTEQYFNRFLQYNTALPSLEDIGFQQSSIRWPSSEPSAEIIRHYDKTRDFPSNESGTSRIGVHLRFGTISIRQLAETALQYNETYLKELGWREFYQMILQMYPQVRQHKSFKPAYDRIPWRNHEVEFECWKAGKTGFPIVDAGMRELAATGYMHNRVRMITASFLCKNLLIDWRWGEAWFAEKLLDFDFASNNGGWQWAAGSGCDAAPYFRIFNPITQAQKFDPDEVYIRKWVKEYGTPGYPEPIVDLKSSRERCLQVYRTALA